MKDNPSYPEKNRRPVKTVSVVIPTLNEAANISGALDSLEEQEVVHEIIVVDGGSIDGTGGIAERMGAKVITGPKGRGLQIYEGVIRCRGDVVLILHADCRIRPGVIKRLVVQLNRNPRALGGAVGMEYDSNTLRTRLLSWLNNVRAKNTGVAFGDQCQFFRRRSLNLFGGYPAQMLMEDIELSMRLKAAGTLCFIPRGVVVSQRRWEEKGFIRNFARVITLSSRYLIMRRFKRAERIAKDLYTRYYGSP
ncbi:TIGR04283 family arsenosugar biosynthesis glycosyltransferase [Thermodesulfobacteriota bacterium]